MPFPGMEEVNHRFVGLFVPSSWSRSGLLKAGRVATSVASFGVVTMEIPRPDAKVVLV